MLTTFADYMKLRFSICPSSLATRIGMFACEKYLPEL